MPLLHGEPQRDFVVNLGKRVASVMAFDLEVLELDHAGTLLISAQRLPVRVHLLITLQRNDVCACF